MIGPFADNDLLSLARFLAINLDGILTRAKEVSQVVPDLPGGDLILENAVRDGHVRGIILFYSVMTILLGVIDIVLLKGIDDGKKGDSNDTVNLKMLTKPLKMPAVWLMIGIIFATLTISTGYYYISPYVTEVFGVSALLGAVLSSSSQYIRPIASFGAGVLGDRINNSKVMLIGQIGLAIALVIILAVPSSMGVLPILVACLMIFFCMYMCVTMHFAIMDEEYFPPECVGTAIGLICAIGYLPEATSPFVAGVILDHFPGAAGYRLFFVYLFAVTVFGLVLTVIWLRRDTEYTIRLSNALPCFLVSKSHVVHMRKMLEGLSFITESEPHYWRWSRRRSAFSFDVRLLA